MESLSVQTWLAVYVIKRIRRAYMLRQCEFDLANERMRRKGTCHKN
jgi:hypothetical protein